MSETSNPFIELRKIQWFRTGLSRLDWHVNNPEYDWHHQEAGKLPRIHHWRLYRFCVQDIILGLTVIRHQPIKNCLEVDVFLTASIPEYAPESGIHALALLILSDAFKNGSSMRIEFSEHVEGKRIPEDLVSLARSKGIEFELEEFGIIEPFESKQLFIALTGFSAQIQDKLNRLEEANLVSSALTCYAVNHGIWDKQEVEMLLLTCSNPILLLGGQALPEQRQLFIQSLFYGRAALLFGSLDRHLRSRVHQTDKGTLHLEDDQRDLDLYIDEKNYLIKYCCRNEEITIPWVLEKSSSFQISKISISIPPGKFFEVLIRAYDLEDINENLNKDINIAEDILKNSNTEMIFILLTNDFERLSEEEKQRIFKIVPENIKLMIYPHFNSSLDEDIIKKISLSKVLRDL